MEDIEFFGAVDRKGGKEDGAITSQKPAWMHDFQIDELKYNIGRMKSEIERGVVPGDHIMNMKEDIKRHQDKLELIEKAKPQLDAADKDKMAKVYDKLGKVIKDDMFTYSEMQLGTASPQEEAKRMVDKRIPLEALGLTPRMAENLNLRHENGKVSRDDASTAFQVYGNLLGEPTNVEVLRRDKVTQRTGRRPKNS